MRLRTFSEAGGRAGRSATPRIGAIRTQAYIEVTEELTDLNRALRDSVAAAPGSEFSDGRAESTEAPIPRDRRIAPSWRLDRMRRIEEVRAGQKNPPIPPNFQSRIERPRRGNRRPTAGASQNPIVVSRCPSRMGREVLNPLLGPLFGPQNHGPF